MQINNVIKLNRFHNESPVEADHRISISNSFRGSTLTIKCVINSDAGEYTCRRKANPSFVHKYDLKIQIW